MNGLSQEAEDKIKKFMTSPGFFPDLAEFLQKKKSPHVPPKYLQR